MASIGLRQRLLTVGDSPFAHNYLVLYDDHGNVVGELHGLAADPVTGKAVFKAVAAIIFELSTTPVESYTARASPSRFFGKDHTMMR